LTALPFCSVLLVSPFRERGAKVVELTRRAAFLGFPRQQISLVSKNALPTEATRQAAYINSSISRFIVQDFDARYKEETEQAAFPWPRAYLQDILPIVGRFSVTNTG
jgi:hypothetical protein